MTTTLPPPTKSMIALTMGEIIKTVDEHARQVNKRWGFNRLPHLVPPDWTERFVSQKRKWELACFECVGSLVPADLERVRRHGEAMIRAYDKLEEIAASAGHASGPPSWWEFELKDGTPVILVRDRAELGQVETSGRAVQIWSLEEIADIIAKFPDISRAKDAFPGAEVIQMRTSAKVHDALNDSLDGLPFAVGE
ncbi:MAG: hypothetical protein WCZ66_12065 [Sphingomonadaceae bacterium]